MLTMFSRVQLGQEGLSVRINTRSRSSFRGQLSRTRAASKSIESTTVAVDGSELELLKCVGSGDAKAPPVLVWR